MDPIIGGALIGAGGSLLSGLIGGSGVRSQNAANAKQAQLNRDFQERMSSTAHQRQVTDLRAAGLNPILSATKGTGASTPSGAQAQMQNALEPMANSARDVAQQYANIKLTLAQAKKAENEGKITSGAAELGDKAGEVIEKVLPDVSSAKQSLNDMGKWLGSEIYDLLNPRYENKPISKSSPKFKLDTKKQGNH